MTSAFVIHNVHNVEFNTTVSQILFLLTYWIENVFMTFFFCMQFKIMDQFCVPSLSFRMIEMAGKVMPFYRNISLAQNFKNVLFLGNRA